MTTPAILRREAVTREHLVGWVRGLGSWIRDTFEDRLGSDVDALTDLRDGTAIGTICEDCAAEDYRKRTAKRVVDRGISWPCGSCGSESGLQAVRQVWIRRSDVVRRLQAVPVYAPEPVYSEDRTKADSWKQGSATIAAWRPRHEG